MAEVNWAPQGGYNIEPLGGGKYRVADKLGLSDRSMTVDTAAPGFNADTTLKALQQNLNTLAHQRKLNAGIVQGKDAPFGLQLKASGIRDSQKRARFYAQEMGIPEDALRIYRGSPGYIDPEDGQFKRFEIGDAADFWSGAAPAALEFLGGTAGAVAGGAVGGVPGAIAGGAAGAGGATYLGQELSEAITGQEQTMAEQWPDIAMSAAFEGVGGALGAIVRRARHMTPGLRRLTRGDMDNIAKRHAQAIREGVPERQAFEETAQWISREYGTDPIVTPQQRIGTPEALADQAAMSGQEGYSSRLSRVFQEQSDQSKELAQRYLDAEFGVPKGTRKETARGLVGQARNVITQGDEALRQQAQEAYGQAFSQQPTIGASPIRRAISTLEEFRGTRGISKELAEEIDRAVRPGDGPDAASFEQLHDNVKGALSDAIGAARQRGEDVAVAKLSQAQAEMTDYMKAMSQTYTDASALWKELKDGQRAAYSVLRDIADTTPRSLRRVSDNLFRGADPEDITQVRSFINSQDGGEEVWSRVVRDYMQGEVDKTAQRSLSGTRYTSKDIKVPQRLSMLFNSEPRAKVMKAAMTDKQFEGFQKMADVLDRMAKTVELNPTPQQRGTISGVIQGVTKPAHDAMYEAYWKAFDRIMAKPELLDDLPAIDFKRRTLSGNVQLLRRFLTSLGINVGLQGTDDNQASTDRLLRRTNQMFNSGAEAAKGILQ